METHQGSCRGHRKGMALVQTLLKILGSNRVCVGMKSMAAKAFHNVKRCQQNLLENARTPVSAMMNQAKGLRHNGQGQLTKSLARRGKNPLDG